MSYQPTNLESRRIMTETIKTLLQPIQNRLNAATPGPWDRHDAQIRHTQIDGWVDPEGRKAAQEQTERDIQFVMNAPTDQARLLAAVAAVERTAQYLDKLADGDRHYANLFRKAVIDALTEAR